MSKNSNDPSGEPEFDDVDIHPAANIFPMMSDVEFTDHINSVNKIGQIDPVVFFDGRLLDGRNRYKAAKVLGKEPLIVHKTADEIPDPVAYVLAKNKERRQLKPSQLAMVAARAKEVYAAEAKERQKAAGIAGNKSRHAPESAGGGTGATTGANGKSRDLAGQSVGVSGRSVQNAERVLAKGSKALQQAVDSGSIAVKAAAKLVEAVPNKNKQSAVVKQGSEAVKSVLQSRSGAPSRLDTPQPVKERKGVPSNTRTPEMKVRETLEAIATANGKFTSLKAVLGEKVWKDGRENLKSVAAYCETYLEEIGKPVK